MRNGVNDSRVSRKRPPALPNGKSGLKAKRPLTAKAKAELIRLITASSPGDSLPTYSELAARLGCSIAPIKDAAQQLHSEGRLSLHRGRPPKVLLSPSFSRSARLFENAHHSRAFDLSFRRLHSDEALVGVEMGLPPDAECLVCGRVRFLNNKPASLQVAYINPSFFSDPKSFFLEHDVINGSLAEIYSGLGFRPLEISAVLKPGIPDQRERSLLALEPADTIAVLRKRQKTIVERDGRAEILEFLIATYTQDIDYLVTRLPNWTNSEDNL